MFGSPITLFRAFGIPIRLDLSWFIIFALLSWSLALQYPAYYKDLPPATYWIMGIVGALGLFASIVIHELSHALTARRFGISIKGITLFVFGGVAEMEEEPPSAQAELFVAVAGPVASVLIAVVSLACYYLGQAAAWPPSVMGVLWTIGLLNLVLVLFNLIPAFPLDGGRVFRSMLWALRGDLKWATRVTSTMGGGFGLLLIALGVAFFMTGLFIPGLWYVLVGMFLRGAAQMSYQQLLVRQALEGETIRRFMRTEVHVVTPDITVEELVEEHIYRWHHKLFPVLDNHRLLGCVTTRDVQQAPRHDWPRLTVREILRPCDGTNTILPSEDAQQALTRMSSSGTSRLMVVENDQLKGIVSLKDLLNFIALKIELEVDAQRPDQSTPRSMDERAMTKRANEPQVHP